MCIYTALRRDGVLSRSFMTLSLIGISLPTFLIGILMILFFGVMLRWLPRFGRGDVVQLGWWSTGFLTKSGWQSLRSDERRVGKECGGTGRSRWCPYH